MVTVARRAEAPPVDAGAATSRVWLSRRSAAIVLAAPRAATNLASRAPAPVAPARGAIANTATSNPQSSAAAPIPTRFLLAWAGATRRPRLADFVSGSSQVVHKPQRKLRLGL